MLVIKYLVESRSLQSRILTSKLALCEVHVLPIGPIVAALVMCVSLSAFRGSFSKAHLFA